MKHRQPCHRTPICCVLGHVDAGKTSVLDAIRCTKITDTEFGGITQIISAWNIEKESIEQIIQQFPSKTKPKVHTNFVFIDTPGHEAFRELRAKGVLVCDFAILVVDIFDGIQPQTIESLEFIRRNKIPFVVAVNKVDRIFGWPTINGDDDKTVSTARSITKTLHTVTKELQRHFDRLFVQFANYSINVDWFYRNKDHRTVVNMVPISAKTKEGLPELLGVILKLSEKFLADRLESTSTFKGLVLDNVGSSIPGHRCCLKILLLEGTLHNGQTIYNRDGQYTVKCIMDPMCTTKSKSFDSISAASYVVVSVAADATNESSLESGSVLVSSHDDDVDSQQKSVPESQRGVVALTPNTSSEWGVWVCAPSSDILAAVLHVFRYNHNIPVIGTTVSRVIGKDTIYKLVNRVQKFPTLVTYQCELNDLAVTTSKEYRTLEWITDPVIYRLPDLTKARFDMWTRHAESVKVKLQYDTTFPCKLLVTDVIKKKNPLIIVVTVQIGRLQRGNCLHTLYFEGDVGPTIDIRNENGDSQDYALAGTNVSVSIDTKKQITPGTELYSVLTAKGLSNLKTYFRDTLDRDTVILAKKLKRAFQTI